MPADDVVCASWLVEAREALGSGERVASTDAPDVVEETAAALAHILFVSDEVDQSHNDYVQYSAPVFAVVGQCPNDPSDAAFYASLVDAGVAADGTRYATLAATTDWDFLLTRFELADGRNHRIGGPVRRVRVGTSSSV